MSEIRLGDRDYRSKIDVVKILVEHDIFFENDFTNDRIDDVIKMYDLEDFETLNYSKNTTRNLIKKGMIEQCLLFERILKDGKLIDLRNLRPNSLILQAENINGKVVKYWNEYNIPGLRYEWHQVLSFDFTFYTNYITDKYEKLEANDKRPDVDEHLKYLIRNKKINNLVG